MGRCCFCHSAKTKESGRTFHKFPLTDPFLSEKWMQNLPLKDWKPSRGSVLCSDHFTDDCIDKCGFRVRLKPNSIPTCFENSQGICLFCIRKRTYQSDYAFLKFPLNKPQLLDKWIQNMKMPVSHLTEHNLLCSSHLEQSCLKSKGKYLTLKEDSIPTLFNVTNNNSQHLKRGVLSNKENIPISGQNNINFSTAEHNVTFTQPLIHDTVIEVTKHNTGKSFGQSTTEEIWTSNTSEGRATKLVPGDLDSTPIPLVQRRRILKHDHHYEDSSSTLRRKLNEARKAIKKNIKTIKLQKRKVQRLQTRLLSLKEIIFELRRDCRVSDNCLNSLDQR